MKKLDKQVARRIISKLREVTMLDNPRSMGKALVGNMFDLWRYRVGDYRIICDIENDVLVFSCRYGAQVRGIQTP
ncbi:type II toxin-antitoxin system RelE family toxin [Lancefieldella rimae]